MSDYVSWLRGLAPKGCKGVVDNIDARSLCRIADELELLRALVTPLRRIKSLDAKNVPKYAQQIASEGLLTLTRPHTHFPHDTTHD